MEVLLKVLSVTEKDGFGMVPLPMLKLETKSDSFGLSLVGMVIDILIGNKRFQSDSGLAGVCHISHNAIKEKEL